MDALENILELAERQGESVLLEGTLEALRGPLCADRVWLVRRTARGYRIAEKSGGGSGISRFPRARGELADDDLVPRLFQSERPLFLPPPEADARWRLGVPPPSGASTALVAEGVSAPALEYLDPLSERSRGLRILVSIAGILDELADGADASEETVLAECPAVLAGPSDPRDLEGRFTDIVARSPAMQSVLVSVADLAPSEIPIHIEGESGTGKELLAAAIHRLSRRSGAAFVGENCGAIPDSLVEAELFGYEKGAFTGAGGPRPGLVERADGGTLFLDEIGEMSLEQQKKLLRVLEEKTVRRLGSDRDLPVDFRLVSATNRNLEELVAGRRFREDLFYRLHAAVICLPPLRERREDIPFLVEHFRRIFARELEREPPELAPETLAKLSAYSWPGNVRELRNEVWRLVTAVRGVVEPHQLSRRILRAAQASRAARNRAVGRSLPEIERELLGEVIQKAVETSRGNISQAARSLGITRAALYRRLARYGIDPEAIAAAQRRSAQSS